MCRSPARRACCRNWAGVEAKLSANPPQLFVDTIFPPGATGTDLFIDAGRCVHSCVQASRSFGGGKQRFAITFATPSEASAVKGKNLAMTLVSDQGSTETMWKAK